MRWGLLVEFRIRKESTIEQIRLKDYYRYRTRLIVKGGVNYVK